MRTSVFTPRSCIFMMSLNLWDLALHKKRKSETKRFCLAQVWKSAGFQDRTNHSLTVTTHYEKNNSTSNYCIFFFKLLLLARKEKHNCFCRIYRWIFFYEFKPKPTKFWSRIKLPIP